MRKALPVEDGYHGWCVPGRTIKHSIVLLKSLKQSLLQIAVKDMNKLDSTAL